VSPERWLSMMHAFGVGPNLDTYERLLVAYSEPHRHYHTADHISACLRQLDEARDLAIFPAEVELALWFHDAIYSPAAFDNESRSAEWAAQFLSSAGVSREACQRVHQHIMATRNEAQPADGDSALVVDIDLSILGQDPSTYAEFEKDMREHTRGVPLGTVALVPAQASRDSAVFLGPQIHLCYATFPEPLRADRPFEPSICNRGTREMTANLPTRQLP